ncbi:MAG: ECF transporter S component [Oscillospiraceae bacterium]|nr:ECF transporter S component [Oscillospiraceae bacterium]
MQTKANYLSTPARLLTCSAMCLALCLVLPFLTGQIPQIGSALCPMHLPVLLAGYLCGPWWALLVGASAPLLRHLLFSMPPLLTAIAMTFELAAYGAVAGLLYRRLPKNFVGIYLSLIPAMLVGRILWGIVRVLLSGVSGEAFTWAMFLAGGFTSAIPGILVQLLLIPVLVTAFRKAKFIQ